MSHKKHVLVCLPQSCVVSSVIAPGKGFLPVSSKSPCFSLDFTQNNVFACVWLSYNGFASFWPRYAVLNHLSENNVFFYFRYQTTLVNYAAFSLIAPKTCFCLLATKIGCFELYVTKRAFFLARC